MSEPKFVFLDIDGVLNNDEVLASNRLLKHQAFMNDDRVGMYRAMIGDELLQRLKRLLDATGAEVVLSSSWRSQRPDASPMLAIKQALAEIGYTLRDITPEGGSGCVRGNEIRMWLQEYCSSLYTLGDKHFPPDPPYVILDDDSDMLLWQKDHFVHTDTRIGLTEYDVNKAINILTESDDLQEQEESWHSKAFEALSPLRYHMYQMILAADTLNTLNGTPLFHKEILEAARKAADEAECFFTGKVESEPPSQD